MAINVNQLTETLTPAAGTLAVAGILTLTTPLSPTNGGTNQSTFTTGDLLYASASNVLSKLAIGTTGQALVVTGGIPVWGAPTAGPAGSDTQIQYNNAGTLAGSSKLTWNDTSDTLTLGDISGTTTITAPPRLTSGNAASIEIISGQATAGNGGELLIEGGTGSAVGGSVQFIGGAGGTVGGDCTFAGGNGTSSRGGVCYFQTGSGSIPGDIRFRIGGNFDKVVIDTSGNLINIQAVADQSYSLQAPSTGFTITIANNISTLILDPLTTLATGTINMPSTPIDGQTVRVTSSQIITSLTVSGNGHSIVGSPTTLPLGAGFAYIYNLSGTTWYRLY